MPLASLTLAAALATGPSDPRLDWWREARFGMFIHWGLYSIPGGEWQGKNYPGASEWLFNTARIKMADYEPLQKQFDPVKFNAREWVRIAKRAGVKYIVITSKHHDGFCLWDSALTDWDIMGTPFKRDILKELAAACRAEKMKLGFYHSIMDWHNPLYGQRREWDPRPELGPVDMDRYTACMKGQLKELLTNYGDVACLWFDGEWESPWTHERGVDLYSYVRSLQPNIIINNRVDTGRSGMAGMTSAGFVGDYGTPEQEVPARGLPGVDWESCMTMNDSWGFHKQDQNWKSARQLIETLADTASKGGNFLLNVGPTSEGLIPEASVERLAEMGAWLKINGKAVYGTQAGPFAKSPYRWTRKGSTLFCFLSDWKKGPLEIRTIKSPVMSVALLGGKAMKHRQADGVLTVELEGKAPSPYLNVLEISCQGPLSVEDPAITPSASGEVVFPGRLADIKGSSLKPENDWLGFWTRAEDSCSWEADKVKAGRYRVLVEYAAAPGNSSSAVVKVGETEIAWHPSVTGSWRDFVVRAIGTVELAGGKVRVEVVPTEMKGALCNLRSIMLAPVG